MVKGNLELVRPGDDHTHANAAQVKQQPKIIQITVKKWVFDIPLNFNGNAVF